MNEFGRSVLTAGLFCSRERKKILKDTVFRRVVINREDNKVVVGTTDGMTGDEVFELVAEGLRSLKQRYEVDSKTMLVYLESVIDDG